MRRACSTEKVGAPRDGAATLSVRSGGLEEKFHCQLRHARVGGLSGTESAERRVAVDFVKGADLVRAVDGAGADALGREIRMVEDVEVFGAELQFEALREVEILGDLHIPVGSLREPQNVFADVAKCRKHASWSECGDAPSLDGGGCHESIRSEPADAFGGDAGAGS